MNVLDFGARKREGKLLTLTTCYDFWSARILDSSDIDALLVGDSLAMVMHGHESTITATTELMALHTRAVARGAPTKFLITDMAFPSFRRGISEAMANVDVLMKAGTNAVKVEGIRGHEDVVEHIVGSGIPVMGHVGLTPQSVHALGGFKVQGTTEEAAEQLVDDAKRLEQAGCFAIVLECIPAGVASRITAELGVPTIGIGAGRGVDGQVLVLHDLTGLQRDVSPRFVRRFADGYAMISSAVSAFQAEVEAGTFPADEETYE